MRTVFVLLLSLTTFISQGKEDFEAAKIVLTNGEILEGLATMPSNYSLIKSIRFKVDNSEKPEKIEADDIYQIIYTSESNNQFLFQRISARLVLTKKEYWSLVCYNSPAITAYHIADDYYINEEGILVSVLHASNQGGAGPVHLLLKRPNEADATLVGLDFLGRKGAFGVQSSCRKLASRYFKENAELVERIKNKEFKAEEIVELAKAYSKYHETPQSENEE